MSELGAFEAGAVTGSLLLGGAGLLRLSPLLGEAARAEAARLSGLSREARAEALAQVAARLSAPVELGGVHPSWIEAALAGEPAWVRAAALGEQAASPPVTLWLRRRLFGEFVAVPAVDAPPGLLRLCALPPARLLAALESLGVARLALALRATPPAAQAQVAARLGPRGAELAAAIAAPASREAMAQAVRELHDLVASSAPSLLVRVAARRLSPALGGDAQRWLAQRLPRELGLALLEEQARAGDGSAAAAAAEALAQLVEQA